MDSREQNVHLFGVVGAAPENYILAEIDAAFSQTSQQLYIFVRYHIFVPNYSWDQPEITMLIQPETNDSL